MTKVVEPLQWNTGPPTEPGLYWWKWDLPGNDHVVRFCRVTRHEGVGRHPKAEGKLIAGYAEGTPRIVENLQRVWAGPLREPV